MGFSWVCVGIGQAVRALRRLGFLFQGVQLSSVGCVARAHFGFGQVGGGGGCGGATALMEGGLLLWRFSGILR